MTEQPPPIAYDQASAIARSFLELLESARMTLRAGPQSAVLQKVSAHLGVDGREATVVGHHWQPWEHVSVHRGVVAFLSAMTPEAEWFGLPGSNMRAHTDLATLLQIDPGSSPSSADYLLLACSPDATEEVVSAGLICTVGLDGTPVVLGLREIQLNGPPQVVVEVLAAHRATASRLLEHLQTLVAEHDALRGQVLSFSVSEHMGNQLVTFLPRPVVAAQDVILPPNVLPTIEKHVAGPAQQADRSADWGFISSGVCCCMARPAPARRTQFAT